MFIANVVSTECGGWRTFGTSCLSQCKPAALSMFFLQKVKQAVRLLGSSNWFLLSASRLAQAHFYCILAKAQANAEMCHIRQTRIYHTPEAHGLLSNPNTISGHFRPIPSFCSINAFLPKVEGVVRLLCVDNGLLQHVLRKWKCCGIESRAISKLQIQSRDNTLFWLQIPMAALNK